MIVVVPFCSKDAALAVKVLRWAAKLDGHVPFKALLVHDNEVQADGVRIAAEAYFASVDEYQCTAWPGQHKSWPYPQNHQYQETASYFYSKGIREPWFWWEPDATPLKKGWLQAIADEHAKGGKPYTGHIVGPPYGHMTGVGVYPWNVINYSAAAMSATSMPWDVASRDDMIKHVHQANHLIQHIWERNGAPLSFSSKADADSVLSDTAVIFHRCKDGTLIDVLNGEPFYKTVFNAIGNAVKAATDAVKSLAPADETFAVVQLGRYGDIINALPAIRAAGDVRGIKPTVVVAKQFADVLDGVSYVTPHVYNGDFSDLKGAAEYAKDKFGDITIGQVWGRDTTVLQRATSYNVDNWERIGMMERWGERMDPVFDQRDRKRERQLITAMIRREDKPVVAMSLTGGSTSKLSNGAVIKQTIIREIGDACQIVDLDDMRLERIYDAVGLLEVCDALVTSDTAWLHLASDTNVPVAALLSGNGQWMQSETRCNCSLKIRDGGTTDSTAKLIGWLKLRIEAVKNRRFVHVCERHSPLPQRVKRSQSSWRTLEEMHSWKVVLMDDYPRDTRMLGEERAIPFFRDVLAYGLKHCRHDDYVVMTNDDTIIVPAAVPEMRQIMARTVALSSNRIEIPKWTGEAPQHGFTWHSGRDLMCFRAGWLRMHMNDIPDYALGICDWDTGMAAQVRWLSGHDWRLADSHRVIPDCEMSIGLVAHEMHQPTWRSADKKPSVGTFHNRKLVQEWADNHMPSMCVGIDWLKEKK